MKDIDTKMEQDIDRVERWLAESSSKKIVGNKRNKMMADLGMCEGTAARLTTIIKNGILEIRPLLYRRYITKKCAIDFCLVVPKEEQLAIINEGVDAIKREANKKTPSCKRIKKIVDSEADIAKQWAESVAQKKADREKTRIERGDDKIETVNVPRIDDVLAARDEIIARDAEKRRAKMEADDSEKALAKSEHRKPVNTLCIELELYREHMICDTCRCDFQVYPTEARFCPACGRGNLRSFDPDDRELYDLPRDLIKSQYQDRPKTI